MRQERTVPPNYRKTFSILSPLVLGAISDVIKSQSFLQRICVALKVRVQTLFIKSGAKVENHLQLPPDPSSNLANILRYNLDSNRGWCLFLFKGLSCSSCEAILLITAGLDEGRSKQTRKTLSRAMASSADLWTIVLSLRVCWGVFLPCCQGFSGGTGCLLRNYVFYIS